MRARFLVFPLSAAVLTALAGCSSMHKHKDVDDHDEVEVEVAMDQVPAAVRTTIEGQAGGAANVHEVEKATEGGKTVYEADVTIGGKQHEVKVAEDGTLISKEADDDDDDGDDKGEDDDDDNEKK